MLPLKGLHLDNKEIDQPEGTYRFALDVLTTNNNTVENDYVFTSCTTTQNYGRELGSINFENLSIVFFYDEANDTSRIAIFNTDSKTWDLKVENTFLGFSHSYPITGTAKRDYNGNIIIAFRDNKPGSSIKLVNLDTINNSSNPNDYELFKMAEAPRDAYEYPLSSTTVFNHNSTFEILEGQGTLKTGAYIAVLRYITVDNVETNPVYVNRPVYLHSFNASVSYNNTAGNPANTSTTKAIKFTYNNCDPDYTRAVLYIIQSVNNAISVIRLDETYISNNTVSFLYANATDGDASDLTTALVQNTEYTKAADITQLNGKLELANLEVIDEDALQRVSNSISVKWISIPMDLTTKSYDPDNDNFSIINGISEKEVKESAYPGFQHNEVYALYAAFVLTTGARTKGFHIPGRSETAFNLSNLRADAFASNTIDTTYLVPVSDLVGNAGTTIQNRRALEIADTCSYEGDYNSTGSNNASFGTMSYWENDNEVYPSTFPELAGQRVRHHKFPSVRFMNQQVYSSTASYGKTTLDKLGIEISNIDIPASIRPLIKGIEIYFAKRTDSNRTVLGTGILQQAAYRIDTTGATTNQLGSSGGNFAIYNEAGGGGGNTGQWVSTPDYFRMHFPEVVNFNENISSGYIHNDLKLTATPTDLNSTSSGGYAYRTDYFNTGTTKALPLALNSFRGVTEGRITTVNGSYQNYDNSLFEKALWMKNEGNAVALTSGTTPTLIFSSGGTYTDPNDSNAGSLNVATYLTQLKAYKSDIYTSLFNQTLVRSGCSVFWRSDAEYNDVIDPNNKIAGFGGDCFTADFSHIQYAFHVREQSSVSADKGLKLVYRYITQSRLNYSLRNEGASGDYEKFYPKTPLAATSIGVNDWPRNLLANTQPNNGSLYNLEYNILDDFRQIIINNPSDEYSSKFPYRIHQSTVRGQEDKFENWRIFLTQDYYDMQPNKGEITGLGYYDDKLLIWTKYSFFITRDKAKMLTTGIEATLGSEDIFQFAPQEMSMGDYGNVGLQETTSKINTPIGYIWADTNLKKIFSFTGKELKELSDRGTRIFFRNHINSPYSESAIYANDETRRGVYLGWDEASQRLFFRILNNFDEQESLTLSYSPRIDAWISFHSHDRNSFYLSTRNGIFNSINSEVYELSTKGDFYLDIIVNPSPNETKVIESISWNSRTEPLDYNDTINFLRVNTDYQTTGDINLVTNTPYSLSKTSLLRIKENEWFFNNLRDISSNSTNGIANNYYLNFATTANFNPQSWYKQRRFLDKWFRVRLGLINNSAGKSLTLHDFSSRLSKSPI